MMNTRGGAAQPANLLAVISEWMELMKGASQTLPAAVDEYKSAKTDAEAALIRVDASRMELARQRAEQEKKASELDERARQVEADEAVLARTRESLATVIEARAREGAENERLRAGLNEKLAGIDGERKAAQEEIRKAQAVANTKIEAALADSERARRDARNAIDEQQRRAATETAELRARADKEMNARAALIAERESKVAAREAAARKHAAELAELARQ